MRPTLILLQGPQGAGKTTTIRLARDRLLNHPDREVVQEQAGRGRREIIGGILRVDGVLVGFMTKSEPVMSDTRPDRSLLPVLEELDDAGCRVIVCATRPLRSRSSVTARRFAQERGWRVVRIPKEQGAYDDEEVAIEIETEVLNAVDSLRQPVEV
jgi:hypothetical protein